MPDEEPVTMETVGDSRPVPLRDETTSFFWDAAARCRLVVQRCRSCGLMQYPPDVVCNHCQGDDLDHREVSGRGVLYSFAIVERAFHPGFVSHVPYVVALVELDEQAGLRMLTNLVEADPESLTIDMPLEVHFESRGPVTLPQFRPVEVAR